MKLIAVKWPTASEVRKLSRIADPIGFKPGVGQLFKVNLLKCAEQEISYVEDVLQGYGLRLSQEERKLIRSLKGYDVFITLVGSDLLVEARDEKVLEPLVKKGVLKRESRYGTLRALPSDLWRLLGVFRDLGLHVKLGFKLKLNLDLPVKPSFKLRTYQLEAYRKWKESGCKGVVVLPVATGKTFIGLKAIEDLRVKTLILVPTIDLLKQWARSIACNLGVPMACIGLFGGGKRELKDITVMTYDSARLNAERISSAFGLIIADECHHAVSPGYRLIFKLSIAPYRLGLTATPFRSDALHKLYPHVIGDIVYEAHAQELQAKGYLARHREIKLYVKLDPKEYAEYKKLMKVYLNYCKRKVPNMYDPRERFKAVLKLAARDPGAREALRARHKARQIALSTERKLALVEELLKKYADEKVIIFSRYTDVIRELTRRFFIPKILHDTPKAEREELLKLFKKGDITKLATAMALDEGVDVPDASVAIVISGTGSNREYIQRLGRILRPKAKEAVLVEIVTKGTIDYQLARRRRRREIFEERA